MQWLQRHGYIAAYKQLYDADVATVKPGDFSTIIFPGGTGDGESAAIGPAGAAAVKAFVTAGGGYIGTCAGGFLAGNNSCCYTQMDGFCNDQVGCFPSNSSLQLVDMGTAGRKNLSRPQPHTHWQRPAASACYHSPLSLQNLGIEAMAM